MKFRSGLLVGAAFLAGVAIGPVRRLIDGHSPIMAAAGPG